MIAGAGSLWRHRKTGGLYVVTGHCRLEATDRPAVLYRQLGGDGPVWARDAAEFLDGRFDPVATDAHGEPAP